MANKQKKDAAGASAPAPGNWQNIFLTLSVHLTGFTEFELLTTGMLDAYYATVNAKSDSISLKNFIREVQEILRDFGPFEVAMAEQIEVRLVKQAPFNDLARRIILLWYTGIWTTEGVPAMVNASAYMQGLIWQAAETHPAGALQPGYGSWAELPLK